MISTQAMSSTSTSRPLSLSRSKVDYTANSPFNNRNATWDLSSNKRKRGSKIVKTKASLLASLQELRSGLDIEQCCRDGPSPLKKVISFAA